MIIFVERNGGVACLGVCVDPAGVVGHACELVAAQLWSVNMYGI